MAKQKITSFGIMVKVRLAKLDMTQKELAYELGINKTYLNDIIRGRRTGDKYKEIIVERLGIRNETNIRKASGG